MELLGLSHAYSTNLASASFASVLYWLREMGEDVSHVRVSGVSAISTGLPKD